MHRKFPNAAEMWETENTVMPQKSSASAKKEQVLPVDLVLPKGLSTDMAQHL